MLAFLLKPLAGPIASGVAVLLLGALIYVGLGSVGKSRTISHLNDEINNPKTGLLTRLGVEEADLNQCRANRITLEDATRLQNDAVDAAHKQDAERETQLQHLADDYQKRAARADQLAQSILALKGTGNSCADAEHLIRDTVK
jgi:hypothetical protein